MSNQPIRDPEEIRKDCARKLASVEVSGMFSAILGCLLGEDWSEPRIAELRITPDRCLLARVAGEASFQAFLRAEANAAGLVAIVVPVDEVIADRRKKYEETDDPRHLDYEKAYRRELRKKGSENPEIRRNYLLEDQIEQGNFVSRERLLACARGKDTIVPQDRHFFGVDWARVSDHSWVTITNDHNDVIAWFK